MRFWLAAVSWRSSCALPFAAALTIALLLATVGQSQAADPKPKVVLMLHSFGLRSKPWTDYAAAIRNQMGLRGAVSFQEHSLLNARLIGDKADRPFIEFLHALNDHRQPDLIVAIGSPAANFVQRVRKSLFPETPMLLTAVNRRFLDFDQLTENDAVVAFSRNSLDFYENILRVLPQTKTIAVVVGATPSETSWLAEAQRMLAPLSERVQLRWYNKLSFEDILKDAADLPAHSAIFWIGMHVDAAGIAHEGNGSLQRLASIANAPIFSTDGAFFGEGIVGGPMQSVVELSQKAAAVALRILDGEKPSNIKPVIVEPASAVFDWRQMQRWRIAGSALPPGSTVAFRETALWERYSWQMALIIAVILLQAGLIAALLREHRRRQLAEVQSRQRMAELAHVNRFSTAGELTASIAHEINQPLGSILANAETAQAILKSQNPDIAELPDIVELQDIVNDILHDDRRATEVIRRMRALLKKAPFEQKQFDLNEVARETIRFLSSLAVGRKFEMVSLITPEALPILGDRIQLQQVILNLVMNGIEAMRDTPSENRIISIRTSRIENFAQLSVSDRGSGIPDEKLNAVFEPFFTSKAEGMGMGLSIARTIIEAHNGVISAKNRDHGGATFRIRLPLCTEALDRHRPS